MVLGGAFKDTAGARHIPRLPVALGLASMLVAPGRAGGQCKYEVTVLKYPIACPILPVFTSGIGLNSNGDVVGMYQCPFWEHWEAFMWTPEQGFVTLPRPPGVSSAFPADINDDRVICGAMTVSGVGSRGFVYEAGLWTELPPAIPGNGASSSAAAISNAGLVVGQRSIGDGPNPRNAFIWSASIGFVDLGLMGGYASFGSDVLDPGDVAGGNSYEPFLWQQGELTLLAVPGALESRANALSSGPVVVGSAIFQDSPSERMRTLGFVWQFGEFAIAPPIAGYDTSSVRDLSDARQFVGISGKLSDPNDRRGCLWQHGATHDLNELILGAGSYIERAKAINSRGQILADGDDAVSDWVTFVLTPVGMPPGDLDFDCSVGIMDFLALLEAWGKEKSSADLDGDGVVGPLDLAILLANWS